MSFLSYLMKLGTDINNATNPFQKYQSYEYGDGQVGVGKINEGTGGLDYSQDRSVARAVYSPPEQGIIPTDTSGTSGSTGSGSGYSAEDLAYLRSIRDNYLDQRSRLDNTLNQGNQTIANQYGSELNKANVGKENQLNAYKGQRQSQTGVKGENYSQINSAANRGYNSLAGLLGRASGTGSSAYQQMLPNAIGKDVYSKRSQANNIFGKNMQNIDGSEQSYLANFELVLDDLKRQKEENEKNLITGVNERRADIASKLGTVEGQLAAAAGGGAAAIRAAQGRYDAEVRSSRDAIDGLFNKYFRAFTPQKADAPAPELGTYTMDRSQINAGQQGVSDPTNPYAEILKRKMRENETI